MAKKFPSQLLPLFVILTLLSLTFLFFSFIPSHSPELRPITTTIPSSSSSSSSSLCDLSRGHWEMDPARRPVYDETCPFHRNAWNCLRNKRDNMGKINSWRWVPRGCAGDLPRVDPEEFLGRMRNRNIGLVGDSLNENFLVSFLCVLRVADLGAKRWKKRGAWRGGYFPKFNVTVAYHRAVLLAKYQWKPKEGSQGDEEDGVEGYYRVDVDIPADDWVRIADFYDVLVFNTGHWWGPHKFPKEKPLVFYRSGRPILPQMDILDGLKLVLENMVSHIQNNFPRKTLKFWRLQSPRHFYGGEWNHNGSCTFDDPLKASQLDLWFDPRNDGINNDERLLNGVIKEALRGTEFEILDLSHLSEFRADAHPAIWLGQKDAVALWGQDCMHWCLPGVPDTWVDILSELIRTGLETPR